MKKLYFLLLCVAATMSCKKEPTADFDISGSTKIGGTIFFRNGSKNSDSFSWDFGDGRFSSDLSPTHKYVKAGIHTITLIAKGEGGSDVMTKMLLINGQTYSFTNNTDYNFGNLFSFHWNGTDFDWFRDHGFLGKGQTTIPVIAPEGGCEFGFMSQDGTMICFGTKSLGFHDDQHNDFLIDNNTSIYCDYAKSSYPNNPFINENLPAILKELLCQQTARAKFKI